MTLRKVAIFHVESPIEKVNGRTRRLQSFQVFLHRIGYVAELIPLSEGSLPRPFRFMQYMQVTRKALKSGKFDAIVLMGLELGPLSTLNRNNPVIVDICDSSLELAKRRTTRIGRLVGRVSVGFLWSQISKSAKVTYITKSDCDFDQSRIGIRKSAVLKNVTEHSLASIPELTSVTSTVGYFADWDYTPNRLGLSWLLDQVGDWFESNGWVLKLFGPGEIGLELPKWVRRMGFVENLSEAYEEVDVTIAPDFWGSGYKNKVGESLLAARPVLTTKLGSRGLDGEVGIIEFSDRESAIIQLNRLLVEDFVTKLSASMVKARSMEKTRSSFGTDYASVAEKLELM